MDFSYSPEDNHGYAYFGRFSYPEKAKNKTAAANLSSAIICPKVNDPNYLVLKKRTAIFSSWINELSNKKLRILDVGGRLQPYRSLFRNKIGRYVGIDPVFEGLVDVIGYGENLPFADKSFDVAICTQTLNYTRDPFAVIEEIRRVLDETGYLFLSTPAIFPRYHDQRWRFMPDGLKVLLSNFSEMEIVPEGYSISGISRLINLFFETITKNAVAQRVARSSIFPMMNILGTVFDGLSLGNSQFTTNYSCRACK
jgi:SAM-dependent methyltransferase